MILDETLKKRDVVFTTRVIVAMAVLFGLAMFAYAWSADAANYIDDQILFFNKDCSPKSLHGQGLVSEDCAKARVYAENPRAVGFLMVIYYGIFGWIYSFVDLLLGNATYIGSSAMLFGATYVAKRYLLPLGMGW